MSPATAPSAPRLLLITDPGLGVDLAAAVAAALEGGVTHLLLRDRTRSGRQLADLAGEMRALTRAHAARLLIHGDPELALAVAADGVHLPESGLPTASVRRLLGDGLLLGRSCHTVAAACRALADGASHVTLSPLFATRSHPGAEPLGLERFARMRRAIPGPVLALGGIGPGNAAAAMAAGADGVALIRGILDAEDVAAAARRLVRITGAPASGSGFPVDS